MEDISRPRQSSLPLQGQSVLKQSHKEGLNPNLRISYRTIYRLLLFLWCFMTLLTPEIKPNPKLPLFPPSPSSRWCHSAISSSVIPFCSCPQSLPASESFPMSQLFAWGGQSTGVSALASFLPKKSQGWSPSEWTGWVSLQPKGLSRVFSNPTVQKHQFFSTQLSW